jgi:hypothetical protein
MLDVSNWENMRISYSDTTQYRNILRMLFSMNKNNYPAVSLDNDIDIESKDELEYDEAAANEHMDLIYNHTKHHSLFHKIYIKGASFMLSDDVNIGVAIMFSYDYLDLFIPCYVDFCKDPEKFNETNSSYKVLYNKLYQ